MKYIGIVFVVIFVNTSVIAQTNKNMSSIFLLTVKEMRSHKVKKIKPKVSCFEVDYCTVRYFDYNLKFAKCNGDSLLYRRIFLNNQEIKIVSFKNGEYETNEFTFPEYEFSTYIFDRKKGLLKIMSSLPNCTGIACQYQMFQLIDLKDKICYEKIVKYYK